MKKSFTLTLFVLFLVQFSFGQIVISEIMYNDPTSGTDTLEYIEIYNAGNATVNLDGYHFVSGVSDTLGPVMLAPGEFWVVAEDSASMRIALGVSTDQWDDDSNFNNALSNGGELIELLDANGNFVDSVRYDDGGDWPSLPDGNGPSLVLCDYDADNNDPANWAACSTGTGVFIAGDEVFANPGEDSDCSTTPISYPKYDIAIVTTENADGVADSTNTFCELQGIVVGVDIGDFGNIQFTLQDATGGIGVFDGGGGTDYEVEEGDEIIVRGFISQFGGLTQINPDSISVVSSRNPVKSPTVVTNLSEATESDLVRINGVHIVDTSAWGDGGSGFNVLITTGGPDTIEMRIDDDVNLFNTDPPTGDFDVIGIGSQRDFDIPLDEGYQLFPRYVADIITTMVSTNDPDLGAQIRLYPNPSQGLVTIELASPVDQIEVYNQLGLMMRNYQDRQGRLDIDLGELATGMYYVRFVLNGKQWVEKVMLK